MRRGSSHKLGRARAASSALFFHCGMKLDPNTHAYVVATALLTSVSFAIFAMNLIALVLSHILAT